LTPIFLLLGVQEADVPDLYLVTAGRPPGGEGGRQHSNDLDVMDQGAAEDYMASRMTGLSVGRGPAAVSVAQGRLWHCRAQGTAWLPLLVLLMFGTGQPRACTLAPCKYCMLALCTQWPVRSLLLCV
jgi:hypothetical protein